MNATESEPLLGVIEVIVGAFGVATGVAAVVEDGAPSPATLTARIWTLYEVPFANAVVPSLLSSAITIGEAVVPAARVLNVVPPSVEYL